MKTSTLKSSPLNKLVLLLSLSILFFTNCNRSARISPTSPSSSAYVANASLSVIGNAYFTYSNNSSCVDDLVTINFNNLLNNNCGSSQIQMSSDNGATWVQVASGTPTNGELIFEFTPSSIGEYMFRGKWTRTGNPSSCSGSNLNFNTTETINNLVIINCSCLTSFSGEAIYCGADREANYYFTSEDDQSYIKIQGGLTNFTGDDAIVSINGGTLSSSQKTPGGSSNRVITIEGQVTACENISINIKWNSTNGNDIVTGSWSVKDASGNEIAPSVEGLTCQ